MSAAALDTGQRLIAPSELIESPENPRTIKDDRFVALKRALEADPEMLNARPIIATPDGQVVAGNMRLRAIKDLGWDEVPVFVIDLDPARKREWMLRDNQEYGEYVPDQLARLIEAHIAEGNDASLLGFPEEDISELLESLKEGEAIIPDAEDQVDPELKADVLVEVYCSREAFDSDVGGIVEQLGELDGVEVQIST